MKIFNAFAGSAAVVIATVAMPSINDNSAVSFGSEASAQSGCRPAGQPATPGDRRPGCSGPQNPADPAQPQRQRQGQKQQQQQQQTQSNQQNVVSGSVSGSANPTGNCGEGVNVGGFVATPTAKSAGATIGVTWQSNWCHGAYIGRDYAFKPNDCYAQIKGDKVLDKTLDAFGIVAEDPRMKAMADARLAACEAQFGFGVQQPPKNPVTGYGARIPARMDQRPGYRPK